MHANDLLTARTTADGRSASQIRAPSVDTKYLFEQELKTGCPIIGLVAVNATRAPNDDPVAARVQRCRRWRATPVRIRAGGTSRESLSEPGPTANCTSRVQLDPRYGPSLRAITHLNVEWHRRRALGIEARVAELGD